MPFSVCRTTRSPGTHGQHRPQQWWARSLLAPDPARSGASKRWGLGSVPTIRHGNMSALPKVIVVDDTEDHACVMATGLRFEGFEVETASNAENALRAKASGTFDVAMVDLMMPGTNGIALARMIREQSPHTRVVLMSAYPLSERQLVLSDCGAVGFVPTPFDLTELACFLRGKLATVEPTGEVIDAE